MSVALAIVPASGSIDATKTACRIDVTDADQNDDSAFDDDFYPASPEFRYYILGDAPSGDDLKSHVFGVSEDGGHSWNNVIFPVAGSWTLRLKDDSNDQDVATLAVTVN